MTYALNYELKRDHDEGPGKCTLCDGDGYTAEHACGNTRESCQRMCPVQVQCEPCEGTGWDIPVKDEKSDE